MYLNKIKLQNKIKRINVWFYDISAVVILLTAIYGSFFINYKYVYLLGGVFTVIAIYRVINYPIKTNWIHKFFISMGKISYSLKSATNYLELKTKPCK